MPKSQNKAQLFHKPLLIKFASGIDSNWWDRNTLFGKYLTLTYSLYQDRRDGCKNDSSHIPISLLDGMYRYIHTRADIDNNAAEMYSLC